MSIELANEDWIDGKRSGLLGQFASTNGYSQLINAVKKSKYPALWDLFDTGISEDLSGVLKDCAELSKSDADEDVKSTAKELARLARDQSFIVITNGEN